MEQRPSKMQRVYSLIDTNAYYEAYQRLQGFVIRLSANVSPNELTSECMAVAYKFAEKKEYTLMLETAITVVSLYEKFKTPPSEDRIEQISDIFEIAMAHNLPNNSLKYRLVSRAIAWTATADSPNGNRKLHFIAAQGYMKEAKYGHAQGHLVYCRDSAALAALVTQWRTAVYPSEEPLLVLRLTLILLSMSELQLANEFLCSLNYDFKDREISPPIQLAYLAVQACISANTTFFDHVAAKYQLVVRRDPCFSKLLQVIRSNVLLKAPANTDFLSAFTSFLGL